MTTIEFFAWIVVVLSLIKTLTILINPNKWLKVVGSISKNSRMILPISLLLAAAVLFNLLKEISIIQIFAVMLFFVLMYAASLSVYSDEMLDFAKKILKNKKLFRRSWLIFAIWMILILWVLFSLL